ncbi:MAG TPA: hypothetical protein VE465_09165 [Streptosporangiaceae bacterium]|nr:hypothetical protein [Streptosporangiaceae bacterium]
MNQSRLSRATLFYDEVIAEYRGPDFVERHWLKQRIVAHLADHDCRFLLVSGGPGTGKSALFAWLVGLQDLAPRYFLRRLSSHPLASGDAWSVLLSIGNQLAVLRPEIMRVDVDLQVSQTVGAVAAGAKVVGARIGVLSVSPFQHTAIQVEQQADVVEGEIVGLDIDRMVAEARLLELGNMQSLALLDPAVRLAARDPDAIIVVFIDALDELRYQWSAYAGRGDVLEWLAQCPDLPPNVRIVVSSRPDPRLLQRFRLAQRHRLREETIEPSSAEVRSDLRAYAERLLADFPGLPRGLAGRVSDRAQGSFLYLVLWGRALRRAMGNGDGGQVAALTDLLALPDGLDGIYEYFLVVLRDTVQRREGGSWKRVWDGIYRRVLGVLSVAQAQLRLDSLLDLGDLRDAGPAVRRVLDELAQLLYEDGAGSRLFHLSVAEFLTSTDQARTGDDWHVNAAENHYQVAARLIDRYGGTWQTCEDEYALNYTAIHLVAAIRTAPTPDERPVASLTDLLSDPAFGVAKSHRINMDATLGDYVAAHTVLPPQFRLRLAEGLSAVLAHMIGEGIPDLADTLHAVIGYRQDIGDLNEQVLSRLSDPDFLEHAVPHSAHRAAALVAFSHGQATRLRRKGDTPSLDQARRLLLRAATTAEQAGDQIPLQQRGALYYDLAYLHFVHGEHDQTDEWFARSVEVSEQAGNTAGAHISRLVWMRVRLLREAVTPQEYRAAHDAALAYFASDEASGPHVARWQMNVHAHLLDFALLTEDTELAQAKLELIEEDPWIREVGRTDLVAKYQARVATVTGDSARAVRLFAAYLSEHLTDPPSSLEELSRDLYYYGRALADSGDPDAARRMWGLGLRTPDNAANWPWKPRIRTALADLE